MVVQQSTFDAINCGIKSSLTILNAQSRSQGIYTCITQDNDHVISKNVSVVLEMQHSTKGLFFAVKLMLQLPRPSL